MSYPEPWQRFDSHHGRPETYWAERNRLVDDVRTNLPGTIDVPSGGVESLPERVWPQAKREEYRQALDALLKFDEANGGPPIL